MKKYMVFWRVKGGAPNEVYRGSDIIEIDGEVNLYILDGLIDTCLSDSFADIKFNNLSNAVNNLCTTVCEDWKVLKFKEIKK